jgi:hypothetical protein
VSAGEGITEVTGLWSKSHWRQHPLLCSIAMSTPPESANDRRAVPRDIRDGEHDMLAEAMSSNPQEAPTRAGAMKALIWLGVLLAAAAGIWLGFR